VSALIDAYGEHFRSGGAFATITEARRFATSILGQVVSPGSAEAKQIEEELEAALVRVAQDIIGEGAEPQETFRKLVDLYDRQPALGVRSSTSVSQQAYSTPLPLAYLAAVLAQTSPTKTVYEPSAGHGALLLGSAPEKVTVNELNPARAEDLRAQGYKVTQHDASVYMPEKQHDIVILNPPFGTVEESPKKPREFRFKHFRTSQIDHAIALKSLEAMKPDGRAVLILGGKLGVEEERRSARYNARESRGFYWTLYRHFNVTDHFSVFGSLYRKQGAGFPIDMIVVEGRGKSARLLPAAEVPRIYRTFEELGGYLDDVVRNKSQYLGTNGRRPPDIRGVSAEPRNHYPHPGALSGIAVSPPGMADGHVDGVVGGAIGGGNPRDIVGADEGNLGVRQATDVTETTLDTRGTTGVEAGLGAVPGVGERPAPGAVIDDGGRLSGRGGDRSGGESVAAGEVSNPGHTTRLGGMADRGYRPDVAVGDGLNPDVRNPRGAADDVAVGNRDHQPDTEVEDKPTAEERPKQLGYQPKSTAHVLGTLVPANMQTGTDQALLRLERRVGDLDAYVTDRLAYGSTQELHRYFSAEQVDAIALAVSNLENGSGFILGDQTGIGKGRVVAAMIRYARVTGRTPIFVTKEPPLYADMIRDLRDIGMPRFRPLATNTDLKQLPLPDGRVLHTDNTNHGAVLRAVQQEGRLGNYDAIFTTYNQMQTFKGKEPERRDFLRTFAPGSILILDESHEAGGSAGNRKPETVGNRADFARELVQLSGGVVYSSATYAKNPGVMDLYARTDMRLALSNMENLTELVASGGVPLQQTLASMLTEAGQYIRRERSFAGVRFEPAIAPVNREVAENISRIMAEIMEFDRLKQRVVKGMDKELKAEAKAALGDSSTGGAGASSTNFTSIMHNVIDQMLFALKAEEAVQRTLALLRQPHPEKPVLALSNTMGSLIGSQADLQGLKPGDALEVDFGALLHRYLERSREVILGNPWGEKSRKRLDDEELGSAATAKYHAIQRLIQETDFRSIPISPIDSIISRLNREGYRVGEVTGREHIALYTAEGTTLYQRRANSDRRKEAAVRTVKAFNDGELDVIILNRSGSTGISLHASEHFQDKRPRHMMVVQAEADINQFMQMLGRVHRTGQVVPPSFTLLMADIPAEKRPGAVLARKMASLNANTTAARSGGFSLGDIPDFMNEYGDQVVAEMMKTDPELHARLDYPLEGADGAITTEDAIRRVTGRIPLLPIDEQETLYDRIERGYTEYVAAQEAMGESILEASTLNLDAITLARMEVLPADAHSPSPFTGAVYAEIVDAKAPRKPYTTLQVAGKLCRALELPAPDDIAPETFAGILEAARAQAAGQITRLQEAARQYKLQVAGERNIQVDEAFAHVRHILEEFPIGQTVCLTTENQEVLYGTIAGSKHTGLSSNPVAASSWEMRLLLADSLRELTLPLSQINSGRENTAHLATAETTGGGMPIYALFDHCQTRSRETRQIFTGNLLRAWEKFPGRMVNFTDVQGNIRQGLLTKRGFNAEAALEQMGVPMPTVEDAARFLMEYKGRLQTASQHLSLKSAGEGAYLLQTPKAKDSGGKYYLDEALLDAAGAEFFSVGDRMECMVAGERLEAVLTVLMRERDYTLISYDEPRQAREMLGMTLPQFQTVETPLPAIAEPTTPLAAPMVGAGNEQAPPPEQQEEQTDVPNGEMSPIPELEEMPGYASDGREEIATEAEVMADLATDARVVTEGAAEQGAENRGEAVATAAGEMAGSTSKEEVVVPEALEIPDSTPEETAAATTEPRPSAIAPSTAQSGIAEENTAKLLEQGGLLESIMAGEDFHRSIDNKPYIPLAIARQGNQVYVTRYLQQHGDTTIDSEMVFTIAENGALSLKETAIHALGGELRYCDRQFATLFSYELLEQGFGQAIAASHLPQTAEIEGRAGDSSDNTPIPVTESAASATTAEPQSPEEGREEHRDNPKQHPVIPHNRPPPEEPTNRYPSAQDISRWAMAVRDLGLSEQARRSVQTLYWKVRDGEQPQMSAKVWRTMDRDTEHYRPYQERGQQLLEAATWILAQAGTVNARQEQVFKGTPYEIAQREDTLTVKKREGDRTEVILQVYEGRIARTTVTPQDVEMFAVFVQYLQGGRTER
jgi:predicted RNA methylase